MHRGLEPPIFRCSAGPCGRSSRRGRSLRQPQTLPSSPTARSPDIPPCPASLAECRREYSGSLSSLRPHPSRALALSYQFLPLPAHTPSTRKSLESTPKVSSCIPPRTSSECLRTAHHHLKPWRVWKLRRRVGRISFVNAEGGQVSESAGVLP